ncbi:MAG: MotA/TolQ/ExbB proton channel family protein [Pseudomonadota bacterium]
MATANEPGLIMSTIEFFQVGGFWMYPILLTLIAGIFIGLERYFFLANMASRNSKVWDELYPVMTKGNFKQALEVAKNSNSFMGNIIASGLTRAATARRTEDIELAMEEALMEVLPRIEKRTHYLSTLANVATLLGLLGTIIGLIHAFTAVASADPAEKANMLSAAVGEAMNCTAFGLVTAIPMLVLFSFLQSKAGETVASFEAASVKCLNVIRQISGRTE